MKRLTGCFMIVAACMLWLGEGVARGQYARLHDFGAVGDGSYPYGDVTVSGSSLYGMTSSGGADGQGTLFYIGADGSGYSLLRSFAGGVADGAAPMGAVTVSSWSFLWGSSSTYGMTSAGGASGFGTIFRRQVPLFGLPSYSLLHSFAGGLAMAQRPMAICCCPDRSFTE
jgi:uncharacterized repeat protein (TIGR03803 family)